MNHIKKATKPDISVTQKFQYNLEYILDKIETRADYMKLIDRLVKALQLMIFAKPSHLQTRYEVT